MFNNDFYPTPEKIIKKMVDKIPSWVDVNYVLEPSAGKGNILDYLTGKNEEYENIRYPHVRRSENIHAIEIELELQDTLRGKGYKVVDSDFLSETSNYYLYDVIIANPPFSNGEKHLLKAIEIIYSGHIVFLLNAETLKNPYSNDRKLLIQKLEELDADIEYIPDAFKDAERKTNVEVALIYIHIKRNVEDDLLKGANETENKINVEQIEEDRDLVSNNKMQALVDEYNNTLTIGIDTIVNYYKNYRYIGKWINLRNQDVEKYEYSKGNLQKEMIDRANTFRREIRKDYWLRAMNLDEFRKRLTLDKRNELEKQIDLKSELDFTINNLRSVIINIIDSYEDTLNKAVVKMFDELSYNYAYDIEIHNKNIHYYNGWKTNKAFKVNNKVIIPYGVETNWSDKLDIAYGSRDKICDLDKVMNFFAGLSSYKSIVDAVHESTESKKIMSTFFEITLYKKGTIHLRFLDENLLRKFNYVAAKEKNWLPFDYGKKKYTACSKEEQEIIDGFEGKESYEKHAKDMIFASHGMKMLE